MDKKHTNNNIDANHFNDDDDELISSSNANNSASHNTGGPYVVSAEDIFDTNKTENEVPENQITEEHVAKHVAKHVAENQEEQNYVMADEFADKQVDAQVDNQIADEHIDDQVDNQIADEHVDDQVDNQIADEHVDENVAENQEEQNYVVADEFADNQVAENPGPQNFVVDNEFADKQVAEATISDNFPITYDLNRGYLQQDSNFEKQEAKRFREKVIKENGLNNPIAKSKYLQIKEEHEKKQSNESAKKLAEAEARDKISGLLYVELTEAQQSIFQKIAKDESEQEILDKSKSEIKNSVLSDDNNLTICMGVHNHASKTYDEDNICVANSLDQVPGEKFLFPTDKAKRKLYVFRGWFTKEKRGKRIKKKHIVGDVETPHVLYAHWINLFALIGMIVGAAVAILGILALLYFGLKWYDPSAGKSEEEIAQDLQGVNDEGQMEVSIQQAIYFKDGPDGEGYANIKNPETNKLDQKVTISLEDTGQVIYETEGAIAPGYEIKNIKLQYPLIKGNYRAIATFKGYKQTSHMLVGEVATKVGIVIL